MLKKLFHDHPGQTGETYLQHLAFTTRTTAEVLYIAFALFIHGIFPFLFETTASRGIKRLHAIVTARAGHTATPPANTTRAHAFDNILL